MDLQISSSPGIRQDHVDLAMIITGVGLFITVSRGILCLFWQIENLVELADVLLVIPMSISY
jgi:hypothetical protein